MKADLLVWVDDAHNSNFSRIGHIEFAPSKPFVKEPDSACEGTRRSRPHKLCDFEGVYDLEESCKDTKVHPLPLQCENDLAFKSVGWTMAWCQQVPRNIWRRMMTFCDCGQPRRQGNSQFETLNESGVPSRNPRFRQRSSVKIVHQLRRPVTHRSFREKSSSQAI